MTQLLENIFSLWNTKKKDFDFEDFLDEDETESKDQILPFGIPLKAGALIGSTALLIAAGVIYKFASKKKVKI